MTLSTIFTKIANLFLRVFITRVSGQETLGIYLMILPLIGLLINISQAGIPTALFTLIANDRYHQKHYLLTSFKLCFFQLFVMLIVCFVCYDYFFLIQPFLLMIITFVFIATFDALFRSYYLGNEKGHIPAISQVIEEVIRLSSLFLFYYKKQRLTLYDALLSMFLGELFACLFMIFKSKIRQLPNHQIVSAHKDILMISIPTSFNSLIQSFCRSLEPIVFKNGLIKLNYSLNQINTCYGILNGCVFSVLMIPTFLNNVIYKILLPKLSKAMENKKRTQNLMIKSMFLCLLMGVPFSILFILYPNQILTLLFNSSQGANYLKYLALPFLFFYIQTPLQAYLQVKKKQKQMVIISIIQSVLSLSILFFFVPILEVTSLVYSFVCSLILNTILSFIVVYYDLFFNKK